MKKGILVALSTITGAATVAIAMDKLRSKAIEQKAEKIVKFKSYYNMLNQWLILKQEGKTLEEYFIHNGYKTVAIYGMGEMGNRLYDELKDTSVQVEFAIDKNAASTYSELEVLGSDDTFPEIDAIIVSAIFAFDEVEKELNGKVNCPVISLEDIVYEI